MRLRRREIALAALALSLAVLGALTGSHALELLGIVAAAIAFGVLIAPAITEP